MTFTDDELQKLKIWVRDNPHEDDDGLSIRGTKRLLARLEASEKIVAYVNGGHNAGEEDLPFLINLLAVWHKSKGE